MSYSPAWIRALKALNDRPLTEDELGILEREMIQEPHDRNVALVLGSFLERVLEKFIRRWLAPLNESDVNALFGGIGIISSFSSQIKIGYAFGLFDMEMRKDLDRVREIRNTFAHAIVPINFKTPEIETACNGFYPVGNFKVIDLPGDPNEARNRYYISCILLSNIFSFAVVQNWPASSLPLRHISYNDAARLIER